MADRSVRVRLSAEIGDYTGKMANAASATDKLADAAQKAGDELARMNDRNAAQDVARDAQKAAQAEQQAINKRKEGWNTLASGAGKAGLAVTAVGATMVKSYADFDAQMSKVGAATNASAADMEKLKTAAMNAGAEFGQFTSTDAAGALEELGKAGLTTEASIKALSGTMGLAASDNMEVAQAAELTADAMNMFGLSGDKATMVADKLAQGAGAASGSAKDLGQGLSQVGAVANQMGVSMEDTTQSLALFAKNGIKGSDAGTSLKTAFMALANPSKEAAAQMKEMGIRAFDSQGKFVGMRDLMGQLQRTTKGMSDEQKNAALATIFGSDAMRIAGIMAKEGSAGYDAMGKSMEGFGSASEVAAKKTDNLKGRFAELGGAWENLGISIGGAADGPLKKGVEGLTSLLELASRHQGATQNIAAVVAALGGMGLAAAGLVKTVQGVQAFTGALKAIGLVKDSSKAISATADAAGALGGHAGGVSRTGKALGGIGPAAGIAAAAIAGIAIADHFNSQNTAAIDATRTSLEQLSGVAQAANAGLASQAAAVDTAFTGIGEGVDTTRGALALLNEESRQGFMGNAANFMGNLVGMKSGAQSAAEQFTKLDGSLKGLSAGQAAVQMQEISRQNAQVGLSTEKLVGLFPQYSAKLREQAAAMGVTNLSAQELEGWMGGRLPAAVQKNAQAMASAGGATGQMAQQILANADAAQKMTAAMSAMPDTKRVQLVVDQAQAATTLPQFVDAIKALPPKVRTELETIAKTEGLDAAKAKLAEMRDKQINLIVNAANAQTTVAGFVASLKGLPKETVAKLKTTAETKGLDAAKAELKSIRDKSVTVKAKGDASGAKKVGDAVKAVPASKTAKVSSTGNPNGANNVTKAVKAVPDSKNAKVTSTGNTSGAITVTAAVKAVPDSKNSRVTTTANLTGANAARNAVNSVPASKTSTITTIFRTIKQKLGFATGGYVSGPGTGTSDSIDAKLSNGEFVVRAAAVRALGVSRLDYLNRTGQVPRFATGGLVGDKPRFATGGLVQVPNRDNIVIRIERETGAQQVQQAARLVQAAMQANTRAALAGAKSTSKLAAAQAKVASAQNAKRSLHASHRAEDLRLDRAIAGASGARKKALQKQEKQTDLRQRSELAAAEARLAAAVKARDAAVKAATPNTERAKAATELLRQRQQELIQTQRELADTARGLSDGFAGAYGMGGDLRDWMTTMREGAVDLNGFANQLTKLRRMGLSEALVQQVATAGPRAGSEMASEIIAGGKTGLASLNNAAAALQRSADKLGKIQAVGVRRASGGPVWGAGTATSDSIPAYLSNGEYVIREWAARRIGYEKLGLMNSTGMAFAAGGRVGSGVVNAPRSMFAGQQTTFAPTFNAYGPDAREVAGHAMSLYRHEARAMAVQLPGG